MRTLLAALTLAIAVLALAGCRAQVRDPSCLTMYDDCTRACQGAAPPSSMPDQTDIPFHQSCMTECHLRARDCQARVDRTREPAEAR